MIRIFFDLQGDLPVLAGSPQRKIQTRILPERASIKDTLEGLGIPHTEVDLLLLNGQPLDLSYLVRDGDRIEVHPVPDTGNETADASFPWPTARLQPRPLFRDRFVCDQHLGRLARWLRFFGFDTVYGRSWLEVELERLAVAENRAVLTCNRALLKRKSITCGRLIRSRCPEDQAVEVVCRFHLADHVTFFGRCSVCNGVLGVVDKSAVIADIPPRTREWRDRYFKCRGCHRLYWEGSHVVDLRRRAMAILDRASAPPAISC